MRRGQLRAAIFEQALAIAGELALDGFDQRRQRRFGVGGDGQIDFGDSAGNPDSCSWYKDRPAVMLISFAPGLVMRPRGAARSGRGTS